MPNTRHTKYIDFIVMLNFIMLVGLYLVLYIREYKGYAELQNKSYFVLLCLDQKLKRKQNKKASDTL